MRNKSGKSSAGDGRSGLNRRAFLTGAGGAAMAFSIMKPGLARGSQVNSKISLGLIGCGGRGSSRRARPCSGCGGRPRRARRGRPYGLRPEQRQR